MAVSKPKSELGSEIDVAISFLAKNEPLAKQLKAGLEDGLEVFFFPHSQEQLAGTDGLESMRTPFADARVVGALLDDSWGETPWIRVEKTAITDRCLDKGWESLLFVKMSKTNTPPKWLPHTLGWRSSAHAARRRAMSISAPYPTCRRHASTISPGG
jgi:hypothetical protein